MIIVKPMFCHNYNLSEEENNKNLEAFKIKEVSKELITELEELEKKAGSINKKNRGFGGVFYFLFFMGLLFVISILSKLQENPKIITESLSVFILGILAIVASIAYFIYDVKRVKKLQKSEEVTNLEAGYNKYFEKRNKELGVKEEAYDIDVLFDFIKKNKTEAYKGMVANIFVSAYVSDGYFCMVDTQSVYGFPVESFKEIVEVPEKVTFVNWNKKAPFNSEEYKSYKIKHTNLGFISPNKYRVIFTKDDEDYYFDVLPFDYENVKRLLGDGRSQ